MIKPTVSFSDFEKLDLRVGEVKEAYPIEGSKNLIGMKVDFGRNDELVEIIVGLGEYYQSQDFLGKKFIFVANLEPKRMLGRLSNGMILVADNPVQPKLIPVDMAIKNGTVVR